LRSEKDVERDPERMVRVWRREGNSICRSRSSGGSEGQL